MRVLHVIPSYPPAVRYGGVVLATHGLCRALVAAGHAVDVFTTRVDGPRDLDVRAGARCDMDGVGVHYFDVPALRRWYWSPGLAAALACRAGGYDLVHVHTLFLHPTGAAARAARACSVPYVVSPRGMLVRELVARRSRRLKSAWLALAGRPLLERAAALHVTSERERRDVEAFGLALPPVETVPNGIDAAPPPPRPREAGLVLFLGRLSWKKGLHCLLDAMARLSAARLVIAGHDDEGLQAGLAARVRDLGLEARVRFAGPVTPAQRADLYARAAVFVLPSLSENFANTVLEAMAAGCPVVVTRGVGLADEVARAGCGLVCDATPEDVASALAQTLGAPARAAAMGEAGRDAARERFAWPMVADAMTALYARAAAAGGARRGA